MNLDNKKVKINSLSIENWKCFSYKTISFKNGINFYNQENGSGKSTIIQAIFYCIYGKLPQGVKIKELKNNEEKDIKLSLDFTASDGAQYVIERMITGRAETKLVYLRKKGEDKSQYSIGQINEIMEGFFGRKQFIDIIWSQTPLIYSGIFKTEFIQNILSEYMQESKAFGDELKIRGLSESKEKKRITEFLGRFSGSYEDIQNAISNAEAEKKSIESRLKDKTKSRTSETEKSRAERCIDARKKLSIIKELGIKIYSEDEISSYNTLKSHELLNKKIVSEYTGNPSEEVSIYLKHFSAAEMKKMILMNRESGKCPVCNKKFSFKISEDDIIAFSMKDKYDKSMHELAELGKFDENIIEHSIKYYALLKESNAMDDPESIIRAYDKETEEEWKKLDDVNRRLEQLNKGEQAYQALNGVEQRIQDISALANVVKEYNKECISFYISSLLFKAAELLTYVDDKYMSIYYDMNGGTYKVCIADNGNIRVRSIESLSAGEKTVVALSLILACKEIFAPESILILDESLGSLDSRHLENCIKIIEKEKNQTIVVAHNSNQEAGKKF